jgi:hypothetical protein
VPDGFKSYIPQVIAGLDKAATRAFTRTGMAIQGDIRKSMKSGGSATKGRTGRNRRRPASPVGSPPNVQTGALRRDIGYDVTPGMGGSVRIGANVVYAKVHELSRRFPRPFIKPGIVGGVDKAKKAFVQEMGRL